MGPQLTLIVVEDQAFPNTPRGPQNGRGHSDGATGAEGGPRRGGSAVNRVEYESRGVWRQVAVVANGKNLPVGRATFLTVTPEGYTVTVHGKVYQKGTAKTNNEQTPRQSDVMVSEGPHAGETLRQIFKVDGDVLIACISEPGMARPTGFTSQPGSGQTLSIWLRADEAEAAASARWMNWRFWLNIALSASLIGIYLPWAGNELHKNIDPSLGYRGTNGHEDWDSHPTP